MKKFMLVCAILFIANVGCKKMNVDGGGLCGCSPVESPEFNLAIRNIAGDDLLSNSSSGAYNKSNIQLYRKDAEGKAVPIVFSIRQPFSYGDEKFKYNLLSTSDLRFNPETQKDVIYLKLGDEPPYELTMQLKPNGRYSVQQLLIDQKEAEKGEGNLAKFVSVYYLNK